MSLRHPDDQSAYEDWAHDLHERKRRGEPVDTDNLAAQWAGQDARLQPRRRKAA